MTTFARRVTLFRQHLWRRIVDRIPEGTRLPVLSGPLRGWWWTLSHHGYYDPWNPQRDGPGVRDYGYISGRYERETQRALWALIRPGTVFFDIGAHHGFFAALGLRRGATVYAFERDAASCACIRRNAPAAHVLAGDVRETITDPTLPRPDVVKIDIDDSASVLAVVQQCYARWPRLDTILVKD